MTDDSAARGNPGPVAYPPARWKLERIGDGRTDLLISTDPAAEPLRFPMSSEELYALVHGGDRVQAWSAATAEGTFTQPVVSPQEVRQHLEVCGYIVVAPDIETHTKMVQASPWANWIEEGPPPPGSLGVAWAVDVFAADDAQFRQLALSHGVHCEPMVYTGPPEPGDE